MCRRSPRGRPSRATPWQLAIIFSQRARGDEPSPSRTGTAGEKSARPRLRHAGEPSAPASRRGAPGAALAPEGHARGGELVDVRRRIGLRTSVAAASAAAVRRPRAAAASDREQAVASSPIIKTRLSGVMFCMGSSGSKRELADDRQTADRSARRAISAAPQVGATADRSSSVSSSRRRRPAPGRTGQFRDADTTIASCAAWLRRNGVRPAALAAFYGGRLESARAAANATM